MAPLYSISSFAETQDDNSKNPEEPYEYPIQFIRNEFTPPDLNNVTRISNPGEGWFYTYENGTTYRESSAIYFNNTYIIPASETNLILRTNNSIMVLVKGEFLTLPVNASDISELEVTEIDGHIIAVWALLEDKVHNLSNSVQKIYLFSSQIGNTQTILFNDTVRISDIAITDELIIIVGDAWINEDDWYDGGIHILMEFNHEGLIQKIKKWENESFRDFSNLGIHIGTDELILVSLRFNNYRYDSETDEIILIQKEHLMDSPAKDRQPVDVVYSIGSVNYNQCGDIGFYSHSYLSSEHLYLENNHSILSGDGTGLFVWDIVFASKQIVSFTEGIVRAWLDPLSCSAFFLVSEDDTPLHVYLETFQPEPVVELIEWSEVNLTVDDISNALEQDKSVINCGLTLNLDHYQHQSFSQLSVNVSNEWDISNQSNNLVGEILHVNLELTRTLNNLSHIYDYPSWLNDNLNATSIELELEFSDIYFSQAYANLTLTTACTINSNISNIVELEFNRIISEENIPHVQDMSDESFFCDDNICLLFISQGTFVLNGDYNLTAFTMLNGQETNISDSLSCLNITQQQTQIEINGDNAIISKRCIVEEPIEVEVIIKNNTDDNTTLEHNSTVDNSSEDIQQPTNVSNSTANQSNIDESPNTEQPIENTSSQYQQIINMMGAAVVIFLILITMKISFRTPNREQEFKEMFEEGFEEDFEEDFEEENELVKP